MEFKYSCFISYRHGQYEMAKYIINELHEALCSEIELNVSDKPVFVDWERLRGGDFYNEQLATALCQSACMIVVFTGVYFDRKHTYCTREFKAMEYLESKRLSLLGRSPDKQHGLIVPIVFRGKRKLPPDISDRRQYYDFQDFALFSPKLSRHPELAPKVKEIAEYIAERCEALEAVPENDEIECSEFKMPSEEEIVAWLDGLKQEKPRLPGY